MVEFLVPTDDALVYLATHLRQQDRDELTAAGLSHPLKVLRDSVAVSAWAYVAQIHGVPVAVFGAAPVGALTDPRGAPWLMGTDGVTQHRRVLQRCAGAYLDRMLASFPHLTNIVHVDNAVSIRWLKRFGFSLYPAQPHPVTGELFHPFEMRHV